MILTLARRNLTHDKVRLFVTLTGVVFAVVLIAVQVGLFVGFTRATSGIIDHSAADIWIASRGVQNFDVATPLLERKLYQVLGVPGVARADKLVVQFSQWRKPAGGEESIEVIGYDLDSDMAGPWDVIEGNVELLRAPDTVIVDELYLDKLGIHDGGGVGAQVEIRGRRARVVGKTSGIRSFTTSPYVFTPFKNGQRYGNLREDQATYILVKAVPGLSPTELKERIVAGVPDVDVFTTQEYSRKTQKYWMFTTGAGMALLIAAALGLVVGMVVVAQTLYATTMDHLPEFGTLRAMGAPNSYIYRIIIGQAVMSALIGYAFGLGISLVVVHFSEQGGASILLPWPLAAALFFVTLGMCVSAAFVSIHKVTRIDPAMVFKAR